MSFIDDILEPNIKGIPVIFIVIAITVGLIFMIFFDETVRYLQNLAGQT